MYLQDNPEITLLKAQLLQGMREFMQEGDVSYEETDIQECSSILNSYLVAITAAGTAPEALECVREAITKLNDLSRRCDDLIETGEREIICELVIKAGALRGFFSEDEDVTEEWRDW